MLELIALKKEVFDEVRRELLYIGIIFFAFIIVFKIAFYKESMLVVIRIVSSLLWLFALPGYIIMLYWREKIDFLERLVIGIILAAGISGVLSYYSGLVGLNIKYHVILLPSALILIGLVTNFRK